MTGTTYYPEMGETAPEGGIFKARHIWKSFYSVEWYPENDAAAREAFKAYRIKPCEIEFLDATKLIAGARPKWVATVTHAAKNKLMAAGKANFEALLD